MQRPGRDGLFDSLFGHGDVAVGELDWLQAMLDTEAALARALEEAGLAPAGAGAAVTAAARACEFDLAWARPSGGAEGNPVPALVRALTSLVPAEASQVVHRGATSQDIIDTAAMLLARRAIDVIDTDLAAAADCAVDTGGTSMPQVSWLVGRCFSKPSRSRSAWWRPAGWRASMTRGANLSGVRP